MFQQYQTKKPQNKRNNATILESLRDIGGGVGKTITKDIAGKVAQDAFASLFGSMPKSGEFGNKRQVEFPHAERPFGSQKTPEFNRGAMIHADQLRIKQELDAVRGELKALSATIKQFSLEVDKAIRDEPIEPGIYHVNFYQRLRSLLMLLREQIDDSRTWLMISSGRKKKKQYWGLYKKHGTKFGLSSERTMATQTG
ncbi:hypothetical protein HY947_01405 [Candidatus Gottesmanbacteria bacterium]|nr:hypothetical protein [Candidatus Gottesmanbacteria bacterium]